MAERTPARRRRRHRRAGPPPRAHPVVARRRRAGGDLRCPAGAAEAVAASTAPGLRRARRRSPSGSRRRWSPRPPWPTPRSAVALLERGLHVLVEKPIAASLAEADRAARGARRGSRCWRWATSSSTTRRCRRCSASGLPPRFVEVERLGVFSPRSLDVDVVLDLMIHDLQILHALDPSPVAEVRATGIAVLSPESTSPTRGSRSPPAASPTSPPRASPRSGCASCAPSCRAATTRSTTRRRRSRATGLERQAGRRAQIVTGRPRGGEGRAAAPRARSVRGRLPRREGAAGRRSAGPAGAGDGAGGRRGARATGA